MMEEKSLYLRERDMEDDSHGNGNGNGRNCPTTTTTTTTQETSEGRGGGGGSGINNDSCLKNIKSEDHNISCGGSSTILPHVTSNAAAAAATAATTTVGHHHHTSNKEQDRFLPIANVGRIMKKVIPVNGKISKDAKETVQECVSEFISFVTGEASDKCQREKRKTINGDDIIWAITTLGFEEYVVPLKSYLNKYREIEGEKLNLPKQQRIEPRLPQQQQQQQMSQPHHLHQHQLLHHQDGEVVQQNIHQSYNNNNVYSSSMNLVSQPPSFVATEPAFSIAFSPPHSIPKPLQPQDELDSLRHWQEENIGKYIG